jgi:hypothetical protein
LKNNIYIIYAERDSSQFDQKKQEMRVKILKAENDHILVESLKRYNKKYFGASKSSSGAYTGKPVRRINKDQAKVIINEKTGNWIEWETLVRRHKSQ